MPYVRNLILFFLPHTLTQAPELLNGKGFDLRVARVPGWLQSRPESTIAMVGHGRFFQRRGVSRKHPILPIHTTHPIIPIHHRMYLLLFLYLLKEAKFSHKPPTPPPPHMSHILYR